MIPAPETFDLQTAPLAGGTVLLEASAGTGKTYSVVGLLLRMLLERQIESIDQALVVTFTVAATAELKNRLRAGLRQTLAITRGEPGDPFFTKLAGMQDAAALAERALADFDRVGIHTIHGFCKRLLDDSAFESQEPFVLDFAVDPVPLRHAAAADALRTCYTDGPTTKGALMHRAALDPETLVRQYGLWQRYPDVAITPDPPDPATCIDRVDEILTRIPPLVDDDLIDRLANLKWRKYKGLYQDQHRFSAPALAERIGSEPRLVLPELCKLAPAALTPLLFQRPPPRIDHPFFAACDELLAATDVANAHLRAHLLREMDARLSQHKRSEHTLDFQDLLERTHQALQDPERRQAMRSAVRERYRVALIDEFQDTDRIQYEIFADCFRERPLFLIGDPKQSIYGFRGADLDAYLAARGDATARYTLGTNFRTSQALVDAVQDTCGRTGAFVRDAIDLPDITANAAADELQLTGDDCPPLSWRYLTLTGNEGRTGLIAKADAEPRIARDVAAEISKLLRGEVQRDGEALRPRDIAVLTRTNAQAIMVQDELRTAGVVSAIGKGGDILDTDEIGELERLLRAIQKPQNLQLCRGAMATRIYGLDAAALRALDADDAAFDRELLRFERWRQTWVRRGFVVMKEQMFADLAIAERLLAQRGGERRLTNVQQLCEILHRAEHEHRLSPEGLLEFLVNEQLHRQEIDIELRELRLESDEDAVKILTVHGSKGLEYEVVFCPFLWDGRTPPREAIVPEEGGREVVFELKKAHPRYLAADRDRLAEDARLVYVALTRSKRRCYVHVGPIGFHGSGAVRSALCWMLAPLAEADQKDRAGKPECQWYEDWVERHKTAAAIRDLVERAIAASDGRMALTDVPAAPKAEYVMPRSDGDRGAARVLTRKPWARGLHSFSSIVSGALPEPAARDVADPAHEVPTPTDPTGIFAFARGPAAGNCLHAILEHVDWRKLDAAELTPLVHGRLDSHALLDPANHIAPIDPVATVVDNVQTLATARVGVAGAEAESVPLAELCGGTIAPEWSFTLPARFSRLEDLAAIFRASDSAVAQDYAPRLANLPDRVLRGHLVGFVDLVAEHNGRYWVLDWKSNHLGDQASDYGEVVLGHAMRDHDYVLQYHLYVLALHRQLRARLADYDYDRHFGGVAYVFLRGAVRDMPSGMFCDRPPKALVAALDAWAADELAQEAEA
ncbi:MAG: UvrD-helicase domain-containing protein [bacterium]|nr:UvrD-helicase domain-containing protein [bacterium]